MTKKINKNYEVIKKVNEDGEVFYTYKNKKTGKNLNQTFDFAWDISNGFGAVKIGNKFTYFNPSTGKICDQRFDDLYDLINDFGVVKLDDKYAFFNPSTGKICDQRFVWADARGASNDGFGVVQIGAGLTYFNPSTGKLCEQRFKNAMSISGGFGAVKKGGKWTFFEPSTGKLCKRTFDCVEGVLEEGLSRVVIGDELTYFNPKTEFVFSARFPRFPNKDFTLADCLRLHPEEFDQVPTECFRNKDKILKCLNAMADGIKEIASKKGSLKEAAEYSKDIFDKILNKIEKEKQKINFEDKRKEENSINTAKIAANKAKIVNEYASNIKNLGKTL